MADSEKQAQPTFQLVTWDSEQDPANPQNWSASLKWGNVILISVITIIT